MESLSPVPAQGDKSKLLEFCPGMPGREKTPPRPRWGSQGWIFPIFFPLDKYLSPFLCFWHWNSGKTPLFPPSGTRELPIPVLLGEWESLSWWKEEEEEEESCFSRREYFVGFDDLWDDFIPWNPNPRIPAPLRGVVPFPLGLGGIRDPSRGRTWICGIKSQELPSGIPIFQAWNLKERSGRGELRLCGVKEGKSRWDPTEFPSPAASSLRERHSRLWDVLGIAILKIKAAARRSGAPNVPRGHRPGLENASGEGGESSGSLPEFPAAPIPAPRAGNSLGLFFPGFYGLFFLPLANKAAPLFGVGAHRELPQGICPFFFFPKILAEFPKFRERPRQGRGLAAPPSRTLQGHRSHCLGNLGKIRPPCPGSRGPARSSGIGSSGIRCLVLPEVAGTLIPVPIPNGTGFTGIAPFTGISSRWFLGSCEGI